LPTSRDWRGNPTLEPLLRDVELLLRGSPSAASETNDGQHKRRSSARFYGAHVKLVRDSVVTVITGIRKRADYGLLGDGRTIDNSPPHFSLRSPLSFLAATGRSHGRRSERKRRNG
jgi:hypothetical protein